jgi:hypothetical protein
MSSAVRSVLRVCTVNVRALGVAVAVALGCVVVLCGGVLCGVLCGGVLCGVLGGGVVLDGVCLLHVMPGDYARAARAGDYARAVVPHGIKQKLLLLYLLDDWNSPRRSRRKPGRPPSR